MTATTKEGTVVLMTVSIDMPGQKEITATLKSPTIGELRARINDWILGRFAMKAHKHLNWGGADRNKITLSNAMYFGIQAGATVVVTEELIINNFPISFLTVED